MLPQPGPAVQLRQDVLRWAMVLRNPWALKSVLLSLAVVCLSCTCGEKLESYMSAQYGVKFACSGGECRARLTPADARRFGEHMSPGSGGIKGCNDIASRPDVRGSSSAFTDPCCNAGGSACTHVYSYVVSESAGEICVAM